MKLPALRLNHIVPTLIFGILALVPALLILLYLSIKLLQALGLALLVVVLALLATRATRRRGAAQPLQLGARSTPDRRVDTRQSLS
jgi:membrane protein implicated in regulation of membrane protease activity